MVAPIIAALAPSAADAIKSIFETLFPNDAEREEKRLQYEVQVAQIMTQLNAAQIQVNQAEANNPNVWVSGWRPFIGWACGAAFVYHFILLPFMFFICAAAGKTIPALPAFDINTMMDVLFGLLGIYGTQRTIEKMGQAGHLPWQQ